jgi:hypothetical protein
MSVSSDVRGQAAVRAPLAATSGSTEERDMAAWEFRLVEAGQLEFAKLHQVLTDLKRLGWRLEAANIDDGGDALRLLLKRERAAHWS